MKSLVLHRSIIIDGRKSSISLEDAFWECLRKIADERRETLTQLVTGIDASRDTKNLSSFLRVFILEFYKDRFDRQARISEERSLRSKRGGDH
jgi:predicted DNA-binding ribbon-helix-helix protein